ncbi:MAG: redoxin domain-containing protein [Gammaproteobacteria bacterium]|nr:redoxin domain-containing protein [Gammaproteobacteria bacterium]
MNIKPILKKRWLRWTLEILFFVALYFALRGYMQREMISGQAPDIRATTLQQQDFNLYSAQPKPILIHFWATWCGICKLEQDSIEALSKDYHVMTIAMQSGSDHDVKSYLYEHNLSFAVINDKQGTFVGQYGVVGVPASFVIDRNNKIMASEMGYTTPWGLRLRLWLAD